MGAHASALETLKFFMTPADQPARDRFARETGQNFSVIAPAGVGKTTAIAARVVALARDDVRRTDAGQRPRLPKLVVVTYTRKAADDIRDRARRKLIEAGLPARVLGWFNQAFFGTIHSFCLELLRRFGPLAGWPTRFSIERDDTATWLAFQRATADVAAFLPENTRTAWRQFGDADAIWTLAKTKAFAWPRPPPPGPGPGVFLDGIMAYAPKIKNQKTLRNVAQAQARLARWREAAAAGERGLGVPAVGHGGKEFIAEWDAALQPLRAWLAEAAAHAAAGLAEAYAKEKETSGRLAYDDFVRLAGQLLRESALAERIRAEGFSVLLDEAQDTDPGQFAVLLGVTQPVGAPGLWAEGEGDPPAPGRFSMVGDPQQSIYERAEVGTYLELHQRLRAGGIADELTLSVTMRCDHAVVEGVNTVFPVLLNGRQGQATFVPLQARPNAGAGRIGRLTWPCPANFPAKPKAEERTRAEAGMLAQRLAEIGPVGVGVEDWSQVAILAPRRAWLGALAVKLREAGLLAQLHLGERAPGAEPARAWLAALLAVMADPGDVFEIAGVLREIFGLSDDALYRWCQPNGMKPRSGAGHPLSLQHPPISSSAPVAAALGQLHAWRASARGQPLRDAVTSLVRQSRLAERLARLPDAPAPDTYEKALEALLNQATMAEARGDALAQFAQALRAGPEEAIDPVARPGELQLLTCHKAKGLEWDVVVLFGLFREPGFATPEYPRWLPPVQPGSPPVCLYDKAQARPTPGRATDARQAEFERLSYVATTRPRHALIFSDAEALGSEEDSLADRLGWLPDGAARAWWEQLPEWGHGQTGAKIAVNKNQAGPDQLKAHAGWPGASLAVPGAEAMARARALIRRVRPSTLAQHGIARTPERAEPDLQAPPDYPEEQPPAAGATDYGNWWHGLMEHTPWAAGPVAWSAHWEKQFDHAPDPARARAEAAKLLASPLAAQLAATTWEVATELPFLWAEPDGARAFDGYIDFVAWNAAANRWLVVDWKTDHTEGDAAAELRARYGPQVAVYARALGTVYGAPVTAFLYGTRTGILVEVQA